MAWITGMTGKTRITGMARRTRFTGITGVTGMTGVTWIIRMTYYPKIVAFDFSNDTFGFQNLWRLISQMTLEFDSAT